MRTKRSIQINVCVSPAEMRRAKLRAKRETEGNVSALVRKMLFANEAGVYVTPQGLTDVITANPPFESNAGIAPEQLGAELRQALIDAGTYQGDEDAQGIVQEAYCE